MSASQLRTCAGCRGTRHRSQAVCRACYAKLPANIKRELRAPGSAEAHRAAVRAAIVHVTGQPELL